LEVIPAVARVMLEPHPKPMQRAVGILTPAYTSPLKVRRVVLRIACLAALGCGEIDTTSPRGAAGAPAVTPADAGVAPTDQGPLESKDSTRVFAEDVLWRFDLTAAPSDVEWLHANAELEQSISADLTASGIPIGQVGLRYKGNVGTLENCFDAKGNQICSKLSMKLVFNEYDTNKRFYGLKRLNFHALTYDPSLMHDRLAYGMFREMNVHASRATHAQLYLNGEYLGVFSMVEQVDGRFADHRFPGAGEGNLYKERWPNSSDPAYYVAGLKTNEAAANVSRMVAYGQAISTATDRTLPEVIAAYNDVDYLMRYLAVDGAISNVDGITAWYTGPGWISNHNYYWYEEESGQRFWLIPWDLHYTFEVSTPFDAVPAWDAPPGDCSVRYVTFSADAPVRAPGCDPFVHGLALFERSRYLGAVQQLLDGPLQLDSIDQKLDRWFSQIADAVAGDPNGPGLAGLQEGVKNLRSNLGWLRERLQRVHDGVPVARMVLTVGSPNDFEGVDPLGFTLGATGMSNPTSTLSYGPNQNGPIAGATDARFDFVFRDASPPAPWAQWLFVNLRTAGGRASLVDSGVTEIHFKARSNANRQLRVDIESPNNPETNQGVCLGWDVNITTEAREYACALAAAEIPSWRLSQTPLPPPTTDRNAVFNYMTGLVFRPQANGRTASGLFPTGTTDQGFVEIDDVEFVTP
jgi:spore coat protein H